MSEQSSREITQYLNRMVEGDDSAVDHLLPHVYEDLKKLARKAFQGQGAGHTLQPTALVHEAFFRLVRPKETGWNDRRHFFRVAAMAMRQLLTEHARKKRAVKRGGEQIRVEFEEPAVESPTPLVDLVALDEALTELQSLNPRHARIVELRFLAGLTIDETSEVLGVSPRTVRQDWTFALAWLRKRLETGSGR
ncbi:MAG: sigma-70 family RNA polymerase sigma factor [Planctomycetota bacterium]